VSSDGFKETKIGVVPEEWELYQFEDTISVLTDQVANGSFASLRENVQVFDRPNFATYVRLTDLRLGLNHKKQKYVNQTSYNFLSKSKLVGNELLVANIGANVGEVWLMPVIENPATLAPNMIMAKVNNSIVYFMYLYYYLKGNIGRKELSRAISGSGQPKLSKTDLRKIRVLIPSLSEQYKIAEILSTVDEAIEKTDQIIEETKQLKEGLMQKLFTEGIGHTGFKDTKIGRIPEEWEVANLSKLFDIIDGDRGSNYPHSAEFFSNGYCLFLSAKNVTKEGFKFTDRQYIDKSKDEMLRKGKVQRGDFVLTTRGTLGNFAWYNNEITIERMRINSGMVVLRLIDKGIEKYFYKFFTSTNMQNQIFRISSGTAQPQLTVGGIGKLIILIPPVSEQHNIADILSEVDTKIEKEQATKDQLEQLKKGLMQVLLTGQVRVKV